MHYLAAAAEPSDRAPIELAPDDGAIVIELDVPLVSANALTHEHFRTRAHRRERERQAVRRALSGRRVPSGPWIVTITRCASRLLDDDAVPTAAKAARDEVGAFLGCGDGPRAPVRWVYDQRVVREPARARWTSGGTIPAKTKWRVYAVVRIETRAE